MSRIRHLPLLLVSLVAIGALALAWREHEALSQLQSAGVSPDERGRLQKAAWDAERRAQAAEARLAAVREARSASIAGDDSSRSATKQVLGDYASNLLSKMDDPEIRRLRDQQLMAAINRRNAAFYKSAHLTPAQISQFQQLLLERQNTAADVLAAAAQQGINPMENPDEFSQMVSDAQAEVDAKIQQDLGAATYAQYQQFQQSENQRATADQLQQDLTYTNAPLSDSQKAQMVQALAQSNPDGGSSVNANTLSLAQGFLSAPQEQALQNLQQLQQGRAQLQQLMRQNGSPGPR